MHELHEQQPWPGDRQPGQLPHADFTAPIPSSILGSSPEQVEPVVEDPTPVNEDSEPGKVLEWFNGLDKKHLVEGGVATVAVILAAWQLKKKISGVKTPDNKNVFISTDNPNTVSIGEVVMGGLAASVVKSKKAKSILETNAKDAAVQKVAPVSKHLFAMLRKKGEVAAHTVFPIEHKEQEPDYEEAVVEVAGWLKHTLKNLAAKRGSEPEA